LRIEIIGDFCTDLKISVKLAFYHLNKGNRNKVCKKLPKLDKITKLNKFNQSYITIRLIRSNKPKKSLPKHHM